MQSKIGHQTFSRVWGYSVDWTVSHKSHIGHGQKWKHIPYYHRLYYLHNFLLSWLAGKPRLHLYLQWSDWLGSNVYSYSFLQTHRAEITLLTWQYYTPLADVLLQLLRDYITQSGNASDAAAEFLQIIHSDKRSRSPTVRLFMIRKFVRCERYKMEFLGNTTF